MLNIFNLNSKVTEAKDVIYPTKMNVNLGMHVTSSYKFKMKFQFFNSF